MPYWGWIPIGVAAAVLLAAVVAGIRLGRTRRLRSAEVQLRERQDRRDPFDLKQLDPETREAYLEQWRATQERFLDDPHGAAVEADHLVLEVMRERGYPVEDVGSYRSAHDVAFGQSAGEATTEDLRSAMRGYRALFDELLETSASERARVRS
jgi:hypothetical protein